MMMAVVAMTVCWMTVMTKGVVNWNSDENSDAVEAI
jgi:hypothetical protein